MPVDTLRAAAPLPNRWQKPFLTSQKSIKRKTQELLLAFWLEHKFSKEQILTLYLNRVYLGAGTYGIEAASQKYFQKSSRDLNLLEAAIIAGMLKAPSRYNPIASKERTMERAKVVLQNMVSNRTITPEERDEALTMRLGKEKTTKSKMPIILPTGFTTRLTIISANETATFM